MSGIANGLLANASAELFIQTCYNYPTFAEMYKYAAYDALGRRPQRRKEREPS
jgi:NAD(P) transhydrogenase